MNSFVFQDRKMPVKKMQKIGVKRTKRNDAVCKEKLKRQKLEKKFEDKNSNYQPNILDATDLEDEGDVSNRKAPPETIAVLDEVTVSHPSNTVTDGMQNSNTDTDGMQYIAPIVHYPNNLDHCNNLVPSSTDSFFPINYSPKIGGIG
jgi:hypothetical protein